MESKHTGMDHTGMEHTENTLKWSIRARHTEKSAMALLIYNLVSDEDALACRDGPDSTPVTIQ